MRSANGKAYLSDFFNSSAENINDNEPLLNTRFWFHLHQHSVSKEHKKHHVRHLQNTRYTIHTHKNLQQNSANILTDSKSEYMFPNKWGTVRFPPALCSIFYGNIPKHHFKIGALSLKKWEQKTNHCSSSSPRSQTNIWDRLFYLHTVSWM